MLAVTETHPVQYRAPIYRYLQQQLGIPVTVFYGSDLSVVGYRDCEFGTEFAWDVDLTSGYEAHFLTTVAQGGGRSYAAVRAPGLRSHLQALRPQAVLLTGYDTVFHRQAFWASRGLTRLFRAETTDVAQDRSPFKSWLRDRVLRLAYSQCAKLLYIGEHSYQHYRRLGCPESKLVRSPHAINEAAFAWGEAHRAALRPVIRREWGAKASDRVLLFAGKLQPRKRPDLILQAVKLLPPEQRDRLWVVFLGSGDLEPSLRELAHREPSIRTVFAGFQNQQSLSRFYHGADVLILPSQTQETWGLVVNEALWHGVPCLVSDRVGCAPDLIVPGVTGLVFATARDGALAEAIAQIWPLLGAWLTRRACRERVANYSIAQAATGIAQALTGL
ncbi:MAG: glycosyltransferase family 4 protein [Pseudanabaenaceae cyanobacterium]